MRLNKSTNHAIRILIECARAGDQLIKVAEISARLDITLQNTFKIVHLLSRAGYLKAVRGRYGGVRLSLRAKDIRIGQVVRAMETGMLEGGVGKSAIDDAGLSGFVDDALQAFIEVLDQNTLHDMAVKKRAVTKIKLPKALKPRKTPSVLSQRAGRARRISAAK